MTLRSLEDNKSKKNNNVRHYLNVRIRVRNNETHYEFVVILLKTVTVDYLS